MKKSICLLLFLGCFLTTPKLFSQNSEHKCYFVETKTLGTNETILVYFMQEGNNVEVEITKDYAGSGNTYSRSWEMHGVINGNKITFNVPQGTVDMFAKDPSPIKGPKLIEEWILENDQIIVEEKKLKIITCK